MNKLYCLIIMFITCRICNGQSFLNPSVEFWGLPNSCEINTPPDSWTDYSNGNGLGADEANFLLCPTLIPPNASNGNAYARMWAGTGLTGEGMFQNVSGFLANHQYQISFDFAGSDLFGSSPTPVQWHIFFDDIDINQTIIFSSNDTIWNTHAFYFTATNTTHKIGFRAYSLNTSVGSGGIDNLSLSEVTAVGIVDTDLTVSIYPNPFTDRLHIAGTSPLFSEINFYDITSRNILKQSFLNSISISTEQFAKGIYLYDVRNKNGVIKKGKVVKD